MKNHISFLEGKKCSRIIFSSFYGMVWTLFQALFQAPAQTDPPVYDSLVCFQIRSV